MIELAESLENLDLNLCLIAVEKQKIDFKSSRRALNVIMEDEDDKDDKEEFSTKYYEKQKEKLIRQIDKVKMMSKMQSRKLKTQTFALKKQIYLMF